MKRWLKMLMIWADLERFFTLLYDLVFIKTRQSWWGHIFLTLSASHVFTNDGFNQTLNRRPHIHTNQRPLWYSRQPASVSIPLIPLQKGHVHQIARTRRWTGLSFRFRRRRKIHMMSVAVEWWPFSCVRTCSRKSWRFMMLVDHVSVGRFEVIDP